MRLGQNIKGFFELAFVALICLIIGSVYFSGKQNPVKGLELIMPDGSEPLVSREVMHKLLNIDSLSVIKDRDSLLSEVNRLLSKQNFISHAKVYFSANDKLKVEIDFVTPVARVITDKGSYYVDGKGAKIIQKLSHIPRVLLVRGDHAGQTERWIQLVRYISQKEDLKMMITELFIDKEPDISMRIRLGKPKVIFGMQEEMPIKFRKLRIMVSKLLKDRAINKYKSINLTYPNQVVCSV